MKYLEAITKKLRNNTVELKGCTPSQIQNLESDLNKTLPACYKEFLQIMGVYTELDSDKYEKYNYNYVGFGGESIFYYDVFGDYTLKDGLIEQLQEDDNEELVPQIEDNNVFVFACHQGYVFAFFKLDEGDNPPVYGYSEGQTKSSFPLLTKTFVEFLEFYLEYGKDPYNALDE